jgi:hypothetical protein
MLRPLTPPTPGRPRRGAILVVVLALLTLFAIIALAFVFYADNEATIARIHREAQNNGGDGNAPLPAAEYDKVVNEALSALLFGVDDARPDALLNGLRGHDLLGTLFGGIPAATIPGHALYADPNNVTPSVAFNGPGTIHHATSVGLDRARLPNHTAIRYGPNTVLLDPHWTGERAVTGGTNLGQAPTLSAAATLLRSYAPRNAGYTYPDVNNFYLASVSPATGQVLVPSFHRAWLFNTTNTVNPAYRLAPWNPSDTVNGTENNTDWISPEGRYKILRPRPVDQLTPADFAGPIPTGPTPPYLPYSGAPLPYPILPNLTNYPVGSPQRNGLYNLILSKISSGAIIGYPPQNPVDPATGRPTYTGDVQNFAGGVGVQQKDSILIDIGAREQRWNGRLIKPLVSILATDLDGLLSLTAHGNAVGNPGGAHGSNQGFGPWEVNPLRLIDPADPLAATLTAELRTVIQARYGTTPPAAPRARNLRTTHPFDASGVRLSQSSLVNWNAGGTPGTPPVQYPAFGTADPTDPFRTAPRYNAAGNYFDDNVVDGTEPDKSANHPGLYYPGDWPALAAGASLANPFTFPASDLRRLRLRYAGPLEEYRQMTLYERFVAGSVAPPENAIIGTYPSRTAAETARYRLDPAHARRNFFTGLSAGLAVPGLTANYDRIDPTLGLQLPATIPPGLPAGAVHPVHAGTTAFPAPFPTTGTAGGHPSDFAQPVAVPPPANKYDLRNARAALGPIDLNRPLADYRNDPNLPLGAANVGPGTGGRVPQAWADRQNLARDIFARLVVATGANADVDAAGNVTVRGGPSAPTPDQFNALRYLAQVAVNAVDAIDGDDISTAFVWNPTDGGTGNAPLTPVDASTVLAVAAANMTPANLANRVVFGVEKPRLVINEVYSEITNSPDEIIDPPVMGAPMRPARVRFWLELLNPTSDAGSAGPPAAVPIGDGTVRLKDGAADAYRVQVTRDRTTAAAELARPENVLGTLGTTITPNIQYTFTLAGAGPLPDIRPNAGRYNPNGDPAQGAALFGPQIAMAGMVGPNPGPHPEEFNPRNPAPAGPWANMLEARPSTDDPAVAQDALEYPVAAVPNRSSLRNDDYKHHTVLLQRLANPYVAFDPALNPYQTVDYVAEVPSFDAVNRAMEDMTDPPDTDFVAKRDRFSVGKVQPYAGLAGPVTVNEAARTVETTPFPNSFVLRQAPNPPLTTEPQHTFGRHNGTLPDPSTYSAANVLPNAVGTETIMAPYDWLAHPDRPLVNALELLHLQAVKPHQLTQAFLLPPAGGAVRKGAGQVPWLGVTATGVPAFEVGGQPGFDTAAANQRTRNGLYRALDLLRVKPWGFGAGLGGRVHGRINVNTIPDVRLLRALLDRQDGNAFSDDDVNNLWLNLFNPTTATAGVPYRTVASRTISTMTDPGYPSTFPAVTVPVPGPTVDDDPDPTTNPNPDRPFRTFGAADLPGGGLAARSTAPPSAVDGMGLQDTLLRVNPADGRPLIWVPPTATPHQHQQAEMVRKLFNSATTVSNVFAVHLTVVWHEVRTDGAGNPLTYEEGQLVGQPVRRLLLGKEVYRETPGDMRQQYYAVIDRSNLLLQADPAGVNGLYSAPAGDPAGPGPRVVDRPVFTALEARVDPGTPTANQIVVPAVNDASTQPSGLSDGTPVPWLGSTIVIGVGATAEVRTVTNATAVGPGPGGPTAGTLTTLTLSAPLNFAHAAGESVTNGIPAHPGPQKVDVVNTTASPYRAVIPFVQRVTR